MKNLYKGLLVAMVAVGCGLISAPKASAQTVITTTTVPTMYSSLSSPVVLSQPAVIDTGLMSPTVITQPAVINSTPVVAPAAIDYDDYVSPHLFHFGVGPLFNLDLF